MWLKKKHSKSDSAAPNSATSPASSSDFNSAGSDSSVGASPRGPAKRMRLRDIKAATNNFSERNVVGEGSFGKVYRGQLVEGKGGGAVDVAVKKLNPESFQGFDEWIAEVLLLEKVQHPFLISLIGYSSEGGEPMLVYELCEGGSLEDVLFPSGSAGSVLSWQDRVRIAEEAAVALAHLHSHRVIHRDLKPSNILLTKDLSTRLTDFGLAKETADGQSHVSTRVMGTMGYLDPSYLETGKLREQSDVYSFGVILLELITGRRAMSDSGESLTTWIKPHLNQKKPELNGVVDTKLRSNFSKQEALKLFIIAKHCLNPNFDLRPSMKAIVENMKK